MNTEILLVCDIPQNFTSSYLRNYFIKFIDLDLIEYFHFRHRPSYHELETVKKEISAADLQEIIKKRNKLMSKQIAFVELDKKHIEKFTTVYHNSFWIDKKDEYLEEKCRIIRIVGDFPTSSLLEFQSKTDLMPKGNVGTSTAFFLSQIRACNMFGSLIKKLDIDFNRHRHESRYTEIPFDYSGKGTSDALDSSCIRDDRITKCEEDCVIDKLLRKDITEPRDEDPRCRNDGPDDDVPEDWERFEALHNDPYNMTRHTKANMKYEDEIEKKWEKGGSGLVFYTDQMYWNALETVRRDEFFNEPGSFDIDVDLDHHDDNKIVEKDAKEGIKVWSQSLHQKLPRNNKGYQILKRIGWKEGTFLGPALPKDRVMSVFEDARDHKTGKRNRGLLYPILNEKEDPLDPEVRTPGLGYHGPKQIDRKRGLPAPANVIYQPSMSYGVEGIAFVKSQKCISDG